MGGSSSSSESKAKIWRPQRKYLRDIYDQGQQIFERGNQELQNRYQGYLDQINPETNPFLKQLQSFMQPNNDMLVQQQDLLAQGLNKQYQNQLLPGIQSQSIAGGVVGGGRQGVAQGLAMQGVQDAFAQGSMGLQANAYNQAQQAATAGAGLFGQYAQAGMGGVQGLSNLGYDPFKMYLASVGSPAVLNSSSSNSESFSF
jgi:hypothetical protein